jgi:YD repeat-containing protein
VAPSGERSELSVDGNGYLASMANPANEKATFTYHERGLVASLTDPKVP